MSKLFTDINEFKQYAVVNVSYDFEDIDPILGIEEETTIVRYLGRDQLEDLANALANPPLTPAQTALLEKVRQPLALLALSANQFTRNIQESASGSHKTDTKERMPAKPQDVARRKMELLKNAYKSIDILIGFLQRNKADYPLWVNSDAYKTLKGIFIYTTELLNSYLPIEQSHAVFMQYVPIIKDRERVIRGNIGKAFFDELKEQLLNDTLTPENEEVLTDYIQPALAYLAHEKAVTRLQKVHPFGFYFFEELNLDPSARVVAAADKAKDAIIQDSQEQHRSYLSELLKFLAENINDYPTYRDSPAYSPPEEEPQECPTEHKTGYYKSTTNSKIAPF